MDKGLIEKERNSSDQRVVYIKLTKEGVLLKKKARTIIDSILVNLSDEEADLLNDMLEKVRA